MIGSLKGIKIDESITVGNGQKIKAMKMGTMNGSVKLPDGSIQKVRLQNCKYMRQLTPFNLFSVTHDLSRTFSLGNHKEKIFIQKKKNLSLSSTNKM